MKTLTLGLVAVLSLFHRGVAAEPRWSTPAEIERLSLCIALADFPVKQGRLREVVGVPQYVPPLWGSSWDAGSAFWIAALTDPESANGYYALRMVYKDNYATLPEPEEFDVLALDVLFVAPNRMTFVSELNRVWRKNLPELKSEVRKRGITPRAFVAQHFSFIDEPTQSSDTKPNGATAPK